MRVNRSSRKGDYSARRSILPSASAPGLGLARSSSPTWCASSPLAAALPSLIAVASPLRVCRGASGCTKYSGRMPRYSGPPGRYTWAEQLEARHARSRQRRRVAMPGRPPGNIGKGSNLTKVDAISNSFRRQEFLDALNDWGRDYLQILENYAGTTRYETDYLRASWYNEDGFWPTSRYPKIQHPLEPIVRESLIKALEMAKARN